MRYVAIVVAAGRGAICGGLLLHFVLLFFFSSSRMCFFVCQPPCLPMSSARPAPPRLQTVTAAVWEFDTLLSTYTPRAAMPAPRTRAGAAAVGGKIYVAGGFASVTEDGGCLLCRHKQCEISKAGCGADLQQQDWPGGSDRLDVMAR
jgi:hypothetical protein